MKVCKTEHQFKTRFQQPKTGLPKNQYQHPKIGEPKIKAFHSKSSIS